MFSHLRAALALLLAFILICGLAYPWGMTGLAALIVPAKAHGSLISDKGRIVGSELIGQSFTGARYFHGRPSAAGSGYDALASGASNLAPTAHQLARSASDRSASVYKRNQLTEPGIIPVDLITASASGLDPDISVAAANIQADRVAAARNISPHKVKALIARQTEKRLMGFLGETHINVLKLNLALDEIDGTTP